ncbi:MAG: hypothetical protein HQM13_06380 [SAR324 cluster bacterium]|nr:hypothetical protein [SAR324 cluster bacterium]
MGQTYTISIVKGISIIKYTSNPTLENVLQAMDELGYEESTFHRIWDMSNVDIAMTSDDMRVIARHSSQLVRPDLKSAMIASSDHDFGMLRVYEGYREGLNGVLMVFRDFNEAWRWIHN